MCFFLHHTSTYPQGSHHTNTRVFGVTFGPRFFYRAPRAGGLLFFFTFTERVCRFWRACSQAFLCWHQPPWPRPLAHASQQ